MHILHKKTAPLRARGFLLDVEGVLVADKRYLPVEGAATFVERVRQAGLHLRLITNNTTDTKRMLIEKLGAAGFDFEPEELHTCTGAAIRHLHSIGATSCLVLGVAALREMFVDDGFTVADSNTVDAVVVGLDTDLTYDRLRLACDAVGRHGAALIALHRNRLTVDAEGWRAPSVGAIVEVIVFATGVEPVVIGKPSPAYFQQALKELDVPAGSVLVVSDDPLSDLAGAKRMNMHTAFVLSGKYGDESILESIPKAERPDIVADSLGALLVDGLVEI